MVNIPYMDPMGNKTDNTVDGSEILHHLVNRLFSPLKKPRVFFQRGPEVGFLCRISSIPSTLYVSPLGWQELQPTSWDDENPGK